MTLTDLLEIERQLIRWEDERGLQVAEQLWQLGGCPRRIPQLVDFLESVLRRCGESGITYPAVLLKRKKQLERRDWKPSVRKKPAHIGASLSKNGVCPACGGTGVVENLATGTGGWCKCGAWKQKYCATAQ